MFERILVPLDGSKFSGRAVPYAIEISKRFTGEVLLFQVVSPTPLVMPSAGSDAMLSPTATQLVIKTAREQDRKKLTKSNRYLNKKLHEITKQGAIGSYHSVLGIPSKEIIKFCKKKSVDLVVMTTTGKSGIKRAFMGSVADEVIREPGIPVLAIRPRTRQNKK